MKRKYQEKGFTLVELLVVIAIIGVLAAIIAPHAFKAVEKAKVSRTIHDMKALKTAALAFYADLGFFPADPANPWHQDPGLGAKPSNTTGKYNATSITAMGMTTTEYVNRVTSAEWQGPYLDFPLTKKTAWGGRYDYECWAPGVGRSPSTIPDGIYVTIHDVPTESADQLVRLSTFEVVGGQHYPDDQSSLRKVTLKILDWPQ